MSNSDAVAINGDRKEIMKGGLMGLDLLISPAELQPGFV